MCVIKLFGWLDVMILVLVCDRLHTILITNVLILINKVYLFSRHHLFL